MTLMQQIIQKAAKSQIKIELYSNELNYVYK